MSTNFVIDKTALEKFIHKLPSAATESHSQLVAHFGYFLTEQMGLADITPKQIRACYDAAQMPSPANIGDTMRKSNAFVATTAGTVLRRDVKLRIRESLPTVTAPETGVSPLPVASSGKTKNVVVVHGRDLSIRDGMFQFLRSVALNPIEWNDAVRRTGRGSPYTGEVVAALFQDAQAVVVIFSPDEYVELRPDLQDGNEAENRGWQARPNVMVEAGMALARDEAHTILVQVGISRLPSDLIGRNVVNFDGTSTHRHNLLERLRTAGCDVSTTGSDWLRVGDFSLPSTTDATKRRRQK